MLKSLHTHWFRWSFLACIVVAIIVRFWQLGSVPFGLYWDEQAMLVDVTAILQTGKDMHGLPWTQFIYPSYGDYKLAIYIWSAALSTKVWSVFNIVAHTQIFSPEWMLRFPSAVAGIGTVVMAGLIARRLAERADPTSARHWQLFTMLVVALAPWSVMFSRTAFEGHLAQFFVAVSVYFLLSVRKKPLMLIFALFFGALATYTYFSVRFVWPVIAVVVLGYQFWHGGVEQKSHVAATAVKSVGLLVGALVGFFLLLIPMQKAGYFAESNAFRLGTDSVIGGDHQQLNSNILREQTGNTKWGRVFYHQDWLMARELLKNYSDHLSLNFLFFQGDPNLRHGTQMYGVFVWPLLFAWLIGLYQLWHKDKVLWFVFIIWWLVALLPASVPENTPHALRSLNALVPLSVMMGVGLSTIWKWAVRKSAHLQIRQSLGFIYAALVLLTSILFLNYYFTQYPRLSAADWQDGYKQLATAIAERKSAHSEMPEVWEFPFDDRFYLWVMANGQYTGKDFQSWETYKFQFQQFDGYHFQDYSHDKVNKSTGPFLMVGRPETVTQELATLTRKPDSITRIQGRNPEIQFVIAEFK